MIPPKPRKSYLASTKKVPPEAIKKTWELITYLGIEFFIENFTPHVGSQTVIQWKYRGFPPQIAVQAEKLAIARGLEGYTRHTLRPDIFKPCLYCGQPEGMAEDTETKKEENKK